ncbi:hypothetical protein PC118_g6428 [Phytophthora cactorum]|uniref:Uncharacterized protein n=2 Tax=Phytophthora cactorum TaxID=29920 RepID=A0A8T1D0B7_9STRA|nr:hypothetical protein PC112_g7175 [Phytophthora cactorum]KAG2838023.1 hypothetical protein PC111_g4394 [Phytophthora cactorum]KAG2861265.1 hypothetical protein PC113_g7339 [Phytophthora cactorum]KAG2931251.1 hypothetical protein PC115_g6201 [Phytophthora cactorum]KAG2988959.1 hypothetical protein PC118_g6428 [Phytophthora cactorum]
MMTCYARVMLEELVNQQCESRLLVLRSEAGTTGNFKDESNAVAAFLAANDKAGRERALLSPNSKAFVTTQRFLATNYAEDWRRLLANASVDLVAVVTKCWESDDLEPDFLGVVFGALGDEEEAIKEQLVAKQAQFRQDCATQMYRSLFGSLE